MSYIKAFLTILAAQALLGAAATTTTTTAAANQDGKKFMASTKKDTCKDDNEFVYNECGDKKENKQCCKTSSACIEAENKVGVKWEKKFYCSMSRGMTGTKLVKIVLIPMILFIAAILSVVLIVYFLKRNRRNIVALCGVAVIAVAWPLFLSELWIEGLYCCIIALFVSFVSHAYEFGILFPRWVFFLAWAMAASQVIMFLGPIESFHVPFYKQSLGANTGLEAKLLKITDKTCQKHYENFFTLTSIELKAKGANPEVKYFGLCANGWLNFIQIIQLVQAFLWVVTTLASATVFLDGNGKYLPVWPSKGETTQVHPVPPAGDQEAPKDASKNVPIAALTKDE